MVLRAGHLGAEGRARLQQVDKEPGSYWVWRGGQEREPQRELTRVEGREGVWEMRSWSSEGGFLVAQTVKNLPAMQETGVQSPNWEDVLKKGMATHSSLFAWRIPWTEELGGLQFMGLQRVRHDWATFTFTEPPGKSQPLCFTGRRDLPRPPRPGPTSPQHASRASLPSQGTCFCAASECAYLQAGVQCKHKGLYATIWDESTIFKNLGKIHKTKWTLLKCKIQ